MRHEPTGVMCAACNLAGITREIVGYVNDTVPYATVRWDVMGDPRKHVPVCQTCADWRETVDPDDQTFDNLHRCTDCGVTGGGVENGLCQDCAAVPA